jgi:hypothetical protein
MLKKNFSSLFIGLLLCISSFSQSGRFERVTGVNVVELPKFSSLANASLVGNRSGNIVYVYTGVDSGVYIRSFDNSAWFKIASGLGLDSLSYRTMTQVGDSSVTLNSLKRIDTLLIKVNKIDTFYRKPGVAKIFWQYKGEESFVLDSLGPPAWKLNGNEGTGNWIGTIDEDDFVIKRANEVIGTFGDNTIKLGYLTGSAINSVFIGRQAGQSVTASANNTFIGYNSGYLATNAGNSLFAGQGSGLGATNASNSVFIGPLSGYEATGADASIFSGFQAGRGATGARVSIFQGFSTGFGATAATYCILMGRNVGSNFTGNAIGRNNMIFGLNISLPNGSTNRFNFGNVLYGSGTHNVEGGDPSILPSTIGRVGVGVVTPTAVLDLRASTTLEAVLKLRVGPAPTTPTDGDLWLESNTSTGLKIRLNGTTYTINLL